ncbi:MAG: GDP-mannose 4,6-dehydratase, partial [bacterium]
IVKILVTGAAGFVGSHVLKRLKELELNVYGIDNFSSYYSVEYKDLRLDNLSLTRGSDVISCDISDFKQVSEIISEIRPDYIIHLAAQAGVRLSLKDSSSYISANVDGFHNITRSSIENKVKG